MKYFTVIYLLVTITAFHATGKEKIEKTIMNYYETDAAVQFRDTWAKLSKSYENSIRLALKETFGDKETNTFISPGYRVNVVKGLYIDDNVIQLLLKDLVLRDLPLLSWSEVTFEMDGNSLRTEAALGKMFIDANYFLFRNMSEIVYGDGHLDDLETSPFSLHQVQPSGRLAIIMDNCILVGTMIVTLFGRTVNLGYHSLRLHGCRFTVEIPSMGSPPVIAPYFSKELTMLLERLMSRSISPQFAIKLQGILHSVVNTTAIFGQSLPDYRNAQRKVFKKTGRLLTKVAHRLNVLTMEKNQGTITLPDLHLNWDEKIGDLVGVTSVSITNLKLHGLDSAYSLQTGGPYCVLGRKRIGENIRFHNLQIRGQLHFNNETTKVSYSFVGEVKDVTISVKIIISENDKNRMSKEVHAFQIMGWRLSEFGISNIDLQIMKRLASHALITGFTILQIPPKLMAHLNELAPKAFMDVDNNDEEEDAKEDYVNKGDDHGNGEKIAEYKLKEKIVNEDKTDDENVVNDKVLKSVEKPSAWSYEK